MPKYIFEGRERINNEVLIINMVESENNKPITESASLKAQYEALQLRQKKAERRIFLTALGFVVIVLAAAVYDDGIVYKQALKAIRALDPKGEDISRVKAVNCKDPRNAKTPYCQNYEQDVQTDWDSILRQGGETPAPFSLHGR